MARKTQGTSKPGRIPAASLLPTSSRELADSQTELLNELERIVSGDYDPKRANAVVQRAREAQKAVKSRIAAEEGRRPAVIPKPISKEERQAKEKAASKALHEYGQRRFEEQKKKEDEHGS